ncbi:MAG: lysylphosphatidylglycerol synthase transmembrane domain-containing protein [Haloarculaceae archaeon]
MRRSLRIVGGFALALLVVGGFLLVVGPRRVLAELATATLPVYAVGFVAVLGAFWCWSEALRRLLLSVGQTVGGPRYRAAFMSGELAKQVVPMGHSGGPVFVSYAVSRESDAPYESTLAAATVVEFVNIGASVVLATGGLAVLLLTGQGPLDAVFAALVVGLAIAASGLFGAAALVNYRRALVERGVLWLAGVGRATLGRLSRRVRAVLAGERIQSTFGTYYAAFDRALVDRTQVRRAALFSLLGWGLFLVPLYTSLLAIDHPVPYALVVFVVPVLSLVNVVPLPGGLGGFEVALAGVLVALVAGLELPAATAGVFLYRLSNYWFVVLVGVVASAVVSVRPSDAPPVLGPDEK